MLIPPLNNETNHWDVHQAVGTAGLFTFIGIACNGAWQMVRALRSGSYDEFTCGLLKVVTGSLSAFLLHLQDRNGRPTDVLLTTTALSGPVSIAYGLRREYLPTALAITIVSIVALVYRHIFTPPWEN